MVDDKKEILGRVIRIGRGFPLIEFNDNRNEMCSLQCSSAIGDYNDSFIRPGTSYIWLGIDKVNPIVMAKDALKLGINTKEKTGWIDYEIPEEVMINARMHLDREKVADLIGRLQQWLDSGKFDE